MLRFKFQPVDQNHISRLIDKLKNKASYGHDNISTKLIKSAKKVLTKPLTLLVNQMLNSGQFPSELKISRENLSLKMGILLCLQINVQYHYSLQCLKYLNM